jgi:periplasmic copper chaperone A
MGNRRGGGECKRGASQPAPSKAAPRPHTLPRCDARHHAPPKETVKTLLRIGLLLAPWFAAHAHVSLEQPKAPAGSTYTAVLRVTHGCEGTATHTVRVRLPAGFRSAKPMPKAGWALDIRREPLAQPYESHGRSVKDDVTEVTWRAESRAAWLADAHYDEFTLRGQLPSKAGALWFKVEQVCEKGRHDWAEVPSQGVSTQGLSSPAVLLEVVPGAAPAHTH